MLKILYLLFQASTTLLKVLKETFKRLETSRENRILGASSLNFQPSESYVFIYSQTHPSGLEGRDVISLIMSFPPPVLLSDPPFLARTFLHLGLSSSFPNWQLHLNWSLLHSLKLWSSLLSMLKIKSSLDPASSCLLLHPKPRMLAPSFVFCYFHFLLTCYSNTRGLASSVPAHPDTAVAKGLNNLSHLNLMHSSFDVIFL